LGIGNMMFSIDDPFSTDEMGIEFPNCLELTDEQKAKFAHGRLANF